MKLTEKQMQDTVAFVKGAVSAEFIQKVMEPFPQEAPFQYMQGPIVNSIRKRGANVTVEQVKKDMMAELNAKKPAEDGQKKPGDTKRITREYFDSLLIEQRLIGSCVPNLKTEIFGCTFDTPIMTAALSHLGPSDKGLGTGMKEYATGAKLANALHWVGMCENDEFADIMSCKAKTVRIIKPYKDEAKIFEQIAAAKSLGAVAIGMDIDHTFSTAGDEDIVEGCEMEAKTVEKLQSYIASADGLPFVIKGVLSVTDTLQAIEAGASGIIVSHHGGRIGYAMPPLAMLPDIAAAADGRLKIFVDCGICSGMDAYKALALGADAVGVGTHLIKYVRQQGAAGVAERIGDMTRELAGVMAFTDVKDTKSFDGSVLHRL